MAKGKSKIYPVIIKGVVDKGAVEYCQSDRTFTDMVWVKGKMPINTWLEGYNHKNVDDGTLMASATVSDMLVPYLFKNLEPPFVEAQFSGAVSNS
ncbi:hypothetical protein TWF281_000226 [Arthrobotrys megalospora]